MAVPLPGEPRDPAGAGRRGAGSRYLLHSGTEDVIAFVVGDLDRAQELHAKLVYPVAVFGQGWKASRM